MTVVAEHYDFSISLLLLENVTPLREFDADPEFDTYDKMVPEERCRQW